MSQAYEHIIYNLWLEMSDILSLLFNNLKTWKHFFFIVCFYTKNTFVRFEFPFIDMYETWFWSSKETNFKVFKLYQSVDVTRCWTDEMTFDKFKTWFNCNIPVKWFLPSISITMKRCECRYIKHYAKTCLPRIEPNLILRYRRFVYGNEK